MGYELWISSKTGIRRKGTTFKELQSLFIENITTKFIFEPIYCCKLEDSAYHVRYALEDRDFDIVGVMDDDKNIIGYAQREELEDDIIRSHTHEISVEHLISDSTPISALLNILSENSFVFVLYRNSIAGIVTRADINKPIVRIYLFGIISQVELHLNFWINELYKDEGWKGIIKESRIDEALRIYKSRKKRNDELSLLECLQFCDKRTILSSTKEFLEKFTFSVRRFEKLMRHIEDIRNQLAHSQSSITENLEWKDFVSTISDAEKLLIHSERIVGENRKINYN
ncbi:CBS domain-containing protein [Prolixibacter denitrificans]|uniref:CBS domain-containing protein n=1 Tax=Prolixibacter denitrificans TaxID=1541063 RepID=A0A2P8CFH6_9BACT|nr:CBS domain-containing protein [Prolixibacter denitrificans]PSK83735.1 hypothetical protein CLV93_103150 [Prolixibacter denitrificans]GET23279.1 hypothetical protein JCM18694_35250 [Prolixibacter denitrificans]